MRVKTGAGGALHCPNNYMTDVPRDDSVAPSVKSSNYTDRTIRLGTSTNLKCHAEQFQALLGVERARWACS